MKNPHSILKSSICVFLTVFLLPAFVIAQEDDASPLKFALVIGNGAYSDLSPLANPVNDADDMAALLGSMGFLVDKVINGNLNDMENSVTRLKNRLSVSPNSYGFLFYAGHGVQSGGDNFLIPVDANIPSENYLRTRSVSVQVILDDLNDANNNLNVVVLDACRDNPFGWSRSGSRGLTIVSRLPADSIIVYATSAGQRASDGEGRNGVFTTYLLRNLATPGLDVNEVFRRTGLDVAEASMRQQIPAIYNQFFGIAYLGIPPVGITEAAAYQPSLIQQAPSQRLPGVSGSSVREKNPARFWTAGASLGTSFDAPWIMGTLRGTIAPFSYSFFELGVDMGFISGVPNVGFYSFCPFLHYSFYMPVKNLGGWYAGAGAGYMFGMLSYTTGDVPVSIFIADATAGFNFFGFLDVSYTLRTNFSSLNHKVSAGYTYRF